MTLSLAVYASDSGLCNGVYDIPRKLWERAAALAGMKAEELEECHPITPQAGEAILAMIGFPRRSTDKVDYFLEVTAP